jgi:phosphate transport system substrate-binding protein
MISVAGSTTVQPLAQLLADNYMQVNPEISITVQGGGSSVGIKSVSTGVTDIGMSSRELTSSEASVLEQHVIAYDGIAIVCHPDNDVSGLTREQIKDIFHGDITNWQQVGGSDQDIHVVSREEGSGTRTTFEKQIMSDILGPMITSQAVLQSSNGAVRTVVAGDSNAIGFVSIVFVDETVKALEVDGVAAIQQNVENGIYDIKRPLLMLTRGEAKGNIKLFLEYCLGSEGQRIVTEEYVPSPID